MTGDMMHLQTLAEKTSGADMPRTMIGYAAEQLMDMEVSVRTGAPHGERSASAR
jgi:putative transposase